MTHPPKKWKMAILIWCTIYPAITILFAVLAPLMIDWPFYLRTLLLTILVVPFMVFVAFPFINKAFAVWLRN